MIEFLKQNWVTFSVWWTIISTALAVGVFVWLIIGAKRVSKMRENIKFKDGNAYFKGGVTAYTKEEDFKKLK